MPYGHNIATCLHCGTQFQVGDAIPDICPECEDAGHSGLPLDCPLCRSARRARIDAAIAASPCAPITPEERRKRLRVRAALAESRAASAASAAGVPMASFDRWLAVEFQPCLDKSDNLTLGDDDEC
jgi:hypothetical protein